MAQPKLKNGLRTMSNQNWYLSVKQFVDISGYHPSYVRNTLLRNGKLKSFKVGNSRLIHIKCAFDYFLTYVINKYLKERGVTKFNAATTKQALTVDKDGNLQLNETFKNIAAKGRVPLEL